MQTHVHTQALKNSDQSLGEFLCRAGSFIQRGSGYEQTMSQTQSQTFSFYALLFFLVLFWFFFLLIPGRTLFKITSKPSQGFGSDSNINSGCGMLLIWLVLLRCCKNCSCMRLLGLSGGHSWTEALCQDEFARRKGEGGVKDTQVVTLSLEWRSIDGKDNVIPLYMDPYKKSQ